MHRILIFVNGKLLGDAPLSFIVDGLLRRTGVWGLQHLLFVIVTELLMLLEDVGIFEVVGNGIHGRVLPSFKLNVNNCVARLM